MEKHIWDNSTQTEEMAKEFCKTNKVKLYSKEIGLMMNLLSERPGTSGLAQSFRLLTIFDKDFKRKWTANDVRILDEDISTPSQK